MLTVTEYILLSRGDLVIFNDRIWRVHRMNPWPEPEKHITLRRGLFFVRLTRDDALERLTHA